MTQRLIAPWRSRRVAHGATPTTLSLRSATERHSMSARVLPQRGFILLELIVALLVATLLAAFAADRLAERGRETMVENHAAWMASLRQGVQRYIQSHAGVLL